MNNETIHIALAVYDPNGTYSRHAGVTMASVLKNTESNVCFHILHDITLSEKNKNLLTETVNELGGDIDFIDLTQSIEERTYTNLEELARLYTPGTIFRLLVPDVLILDKVIYLDCDIVVNMNIKQLWDISIDDYCLAAADDEGLSDDFKKRSPFLSKLHFRMWMMDVQLEHYFNAGVLSMNLSKIRSMFNMFDEGIEFMEHYKNCSRFPDQDFLNFAFAKYTLAIDAKFDRFCGYFGKSSDISDKILHFAAMEKPWKRNTANNPTNRLYWEYLSCTAWKDHIIEYMLEMPTSEPPLHTSDCLKHLREKFILNFTESLPVEMARVICSEVRYRLKRK